MTVQVPVWVFVSLMAGGFFWIGLGSYLAIAKYRSKLKEDRDLSSDGMSFGFSAGAAYCILISVWGLSEAYQISMYRTLSNLAEDHLVLITTAGFFLLVSTWMVCEALLRKIAHQAEPDIAF